VDLAHLRALLDAMTSEANAVLASEGIAPAQRRFVHTVDLRYLGQYHEVPVETTEAQLRDGAWDAVRNAFHDRHDQLYGYALREDDAVVELVSVRITALGISEKPPLVGEDLAGAGVEHLRKGERSVYQPESGKFSPTPVYDGDRLRHGNRLEGPAIIEKVTTTIFVPDGFTLAVDALGGCVLEDAAARSSHDDHA
jgi:N-methylhydantoinase A